MKKRVLPIMGFCSPDKKEGQNVNLPLRRVTPKTPPEDGSESAPGKLQADDREKEENAARKIWLEAGHF